MSAFLVYGIFLWGILDVDPLLFLMAMNSRILLLDG